MKKHLGFIHSKLGRILGGLALKPKGNRNRVRLIGPAHPISTLDFGLGSGLDTRLDPGLDTGRFSLRLLVRIWI